MADGPAGYWRLDELDTIARDSSGHGHDGTLIQPHTRGVAGASADGNAATRFDGGSVQFQDGGFPLLDGAFSVEAWLRYDETGPGTVAIGNMWRLSLEADRVAFFAGFSENTFADVRTVTPINDDLWHHVVATFDPGQQTASLYVDGVLDASGALNGNITGNALWMIGWLTASVDDVAVYPAALSPEQVARHFELRNSLGGGSGSITYSVPPNPSIVPRTGVVTVAGLDVPFAQAGLHCFSVTPLTISVGAGGGTGTIHVSALDPGCAWVIAPTVPWVSLDVTSGTGAGDVQYTVAQNATPLERTATLTIAGRAVTVGQSGVPIQRPGFRFSVAAGAQHSLALTDAGIVWRWGANGSGQLGDGTITTRLTPVLVSTFTNAVAIAAGAAHSLALRGDGTVWAWGANSRGQLGDGSTTNRTAPVKSNNGLNNVVAIAAGSEHSVALKADGAVWVWGRNNVGQLGDGTLTNKVSPKLVAGLPSPAIAIAAS